MSITTKHLSEVTTSGTTGFGGSTGTPANFRDPDDLSLFSQVRANMSSTAGQNSRAFNRLSLLGLNDWIPAATITTRKVKFRLRRVLFSIGDAPGDAFFISGYRYSLNNGGFWADFQLGAGGAGVNVDSGIFEVEFVIPAGTDLTQVLIEIYAEVTHPSAGGTASASYADIYGFYGYVETYEDLVDLMLIRASSEVIGTLNTGNIAHAWTNPGNAYDNNTATFADGDLNNQYGADAELSHNLIVTHHFPTTVVPAQIMDAVIRFEWEATVVSTAVFIAILDTIGKVFTYYTRTNGASWASLTGSKYRLDGTVIGFTTAASPATFTKTRELVFYRFTNPVAAVDQFALQFEHVTGVTSMDVGEIVQVRTHSKVYEVWLELRIEASQQGSGGWVDL